MKLQNFPILDSQTLDASVFLNFFIFLLSKLIAVVEDVCIGLNLSHCCPVTGSHIVLLYVVYKIFVCIKWLAIAQCPYRQTRTLHIFRPLLLPCGNGDVNGWIVKKTATVKFPLLPFWQQNRWKERRWKKPLWRFFISSKSNAVLYGCLEVLCLYTMNIWLHSM